MANFGGILAGALGGLADVAGEQARRGMKEEADQRAADRSLSIQERLMASKQMMEQRADEFKQRQATMRAGQIDADAKGLLNSEREAEIKASYGMTAAEFDAKDDLLPEEKAIFERSDIDKARAGVTAAEKNGFLTEAKERRGILDSERRLSADEAKVALAEAQQQLQREIADARDARERDIAEQRHKQTIAAIAGKTEKGTSVVDAEGNIKVLSPAEINKGTYKPVGSVSQESRANDAKIKQVETELKRLQTEYQNSPNSKKSAIQVEMNKLTAKKRELQGMESTPAPNPNRKPLSAFGG